MKNIIVFGCLLLLVTACNNSTTNEEPTPVPTNVQNVNGNLPDTSNSVNMNGPVDSSKLNDSLKR